VKVQHHSVFFILIFTSALLLFFSNELLLPETIRKLVFRTPKIDTIGHFIGFFVLAWLLHSMIKLSLLTTFITLSFYGALSEIGQYYLGFRHGEFSDVFADITGISFFILLKIIYLFYKNKRLISQANSRFKLAASVNQATKTGYKK